MTRRPRLSVIVPAFNEGKTIFRAVSGISGYFRKRRLRAEIIVVNDGSRDETEREARRAGVRFGGVRVIGYRANRGKGHALRRGVAAARGGRLLFLDADLSTKPEEWPKLEARLDAGADIAIGSRKMSGARLVRHQPWWRENMGKIFTWLVQVLLVRVSDVTCGFKAFRTGAAKTLFGRGVLDDWSFDAEILFLAQRSGLRIDEVPVIWRDDPDSKVRVLGAALASLKGLALIRWNYALGRYGSFSRRRGG